MRGIVFYPSEMKGRKITVFDTTLRDGEQTPGVSVTVDQKIAIAQQLDRLGVDVIEAGFPVSSPGDMEAVKKIHDLRLNAELCGLARSLTKDVDACIDCGVDMVHVFIPSSDLQRENTMKISRENAIAEAVDIVEYVKRYGLKCMFSPMDATRADFGHLSEMIRAVRKAGADIINIPDTVGIMTPSSTGRFITALRQEADVPYAVHCHNDFGLAVANTIAGVEAGASEVQVTMNGIGERAGNASLAEVVMALQSLCGCRTNINTEYLLETSKLVQKHFWIPVLPTTPIVGENAFAHESGIHSRGVLTDPETFEPGMMTPEMVGQKRRIILGKHAGRFAVRKSLESAGICPSDAQLEEIVAVIKGIGDKGREVTDADLFEVASIVMKTGPTEKMVTLKEVSVLTGNLVTPTAVIKATVNGCERLAAKPGVGPVDAALSAVEEIVGSTRFKMEDFRIESVGAGADALARVRIVVRDEKGHMITAKSADSDIVLASVEALVNAMNILAQME
ncbi:MAG: 2-isopropylmalate synthase [Methanosarcinaceae archaeon]|nr:2-isopropylmalate synthase [Methanosarcinaceae archaeon]